MRILPFMSDKCVYEETFGSRFKVMVKGKV